MKRDDILIRPTDPARASEFAALMRLYEEAIPASERKAEAQIASMMRDPNYRFLAALLDGALVGFAIAYGFQRERLSLLEYMAVDPAHRSKGIGGRLFHAVTSLFHMAAPLLLEVDSDGEPSADHAQRAARKRFYRRLGCREIAGLVYILPLGVRPPQMNLLVHGAGGTSLERETLRHWLNLLYVEIYDLPPSDPRIAAMIAGLPEKIALI